jgi:hypothetical protein
MAQIDLGSIKFNWKGSYSGATAYVVDDVVESSGSSYICIAATTGNAPPNATYWEQMSSAGTNGTDGTDLGTTLTTQGDIVYRDASGLARLGAGTSGQVLQTGGSGANPSWASISSDYVLLSQNANQSSVSTVSFDSVFTSDYDHYVAHITKYNTGGDGGSLHFRWRNSGSAQTASNYYGGWNATTVTSGSQTHTGNTQWGIGYTHIGNGSNNGNYPSNCIIYFHRPLENRPAITFTCTNWDGTSQMRLLVGGSVYMGAYSADGFEYSDSSGGNMTNSGEVTIYGLKNS